MIKIPTITNEKVSEIKLDKSNPNHMTKEKKTKKGSFFGRKGIHSKESN